MDTKRKGYIVLIIFILLGIAVVIGFTDFYIPDVIGRQGVIREIIKSCNGVIIAGCFTFWVTYALIKKRLVKTLPGILILISVIIPDLLIIGSVSKGIMALNSNPITIENCNYELEYRVQGFRLRKEHYYINIAKEYSPIPTRIRIDKSSYDYLNSNTPNITISYYPYVNIAAEIIYQPNTQQQTLNIGE